MPSGALHELTEAVKGVAHTVAEGVKRTGSSLFQRVRNIGKKLGRAMPGTPDELVSDAKLIARRASLTGVLPDQALLEKIVEACKKLQSGTWNPEIEKELQWEINRVAGLIAPATVTGLREENNPSRKSRIFFGSLSIILILVSFMTLIILIPLTAAFNQLKVSLNSIGELIDDSNIKIDSDYNSLAQRLVQSNTDNKLLTLSAEDLAIQQKWQNKQYKVSVESQVALLNLHYFEDTMAFVLRPLSLIYNYYSTIFVRQATGGNVSQIDQAKSSSDWDVLDQKNTVATQFLLSCKRVIENKLAFLGSFILPLLYGLLGASVFLLRSFLTFDTFDAAARKFMATAWLRLGLGAISGLAVGWFSWQPDAQKLTTTPFAIAFIAGFSIELLFSMLDRIISALGTQPSKPTG